MTRNATKSTKFELHTLRLPLITFASGFTCLVAGTLGSITVTAMRVTENFRTEVEVGLLVAVRARKLKGQKSRVEFLGGGDKLPPYVPASASGGALGRSRGRKRIFGHEKELKEHVAGINFVSLSVQTCICN